MTDRIKGFLVTLDVEMRDDDVEVVKNAISMIKHVHSVKSYIAGMEDYMSYDRAKSDIGNKLISFVRSECFGLPEK